MKKDIKKTNVIFYRVFETEHTNPEILAYFPNEVWGNNPKVKTCYAHVGQHSACSEDYVLDRTKVEPCEYELEFVDLKKELEQAGYNLNVKNCIADKPRLDEYDIELNKMYKELLQKDLSIHQFNNEYERWIRHNAPKYGISMK